MQTPDMPPRRSFEGIVTDYLFGRVQEYGRSLETPNPANLLGLREEAYRGNQSRNVNTRRERVVAWAVGRAALNPDMDNHSTVRLEAVLRMPYLINRYVTPATLDVREFPEPELTEEERKARLIEHPRAITGMYTTYHTNPAMTKLIVRRGLLTIDPNTNRGIPSSHTSGMQFDQPEQEHVKNFLLMMQTDRELAKLDSGKVGNLLVPTETDVLLFEHELERGASGKHTALPPIRTW